MEHFQQCHWSGMKLSHLSAAYPAVSLGQTGSLNLGSPSDLWCSRLVSFCLYERQGIWFGSTSFLVPLFHPCGTLVHAGEMYALYIKAITWLQTSALSAVHVHHKVTILQSVFVPSKHIQTLSGSLHIFCEGDTQPFKNTCLLSTGHFANNTVSTKPLIQYE